MAGRAQRKFELQFELLTRHLINATGLGNPSANRTLLIARMGQLSRDDEMISGSGWSRPLSGIWWSSISPTA